MTWRRWVLFLMVLVPCCVLTSITHISTLPLTLAALLFGSALRAAIIELTPGDS